MHVKVHSVTSAWTLDSFCRTLCCELCWALLSCSDRSTSALYMVDRYAAVACILSRSIKVPCSIKDDSVFVGDGSELERDWLHSLGSCQLLLGLHCSSLLCHWVFSMKRLYDDLSSASCTTSCSVITQTVHFCQGSTVRFAVSLPVVGVQIWPWWPNVACLSFVAKAIAWATKDLLK